MRQFVRKVRECYRQIMRHMHNEYMPDHCCLMPERSGIVRGWSPERIRTMRWVELGAVLRTVSSVDG